MTKVQKYIDGIQNEYWYGRAAAEEEEALYQEKINSWIDECIGAAKAEYDNAFAWSYCPKSIKKAMRLNYLKSVGVIADNHA